MRRLIAAISFIAILVCACVLAGCGASQPASSSSASASSTANAVQKSTSSSSAASTSSSSVSSSASSSSSVSSVAASSKAATGKLTATGTVECTTVEQRAQEVGYAGNDFAGDSSLLTLLILDTPVEVTSHRGGGSYTGMASVICLPNDEMFRRFNGKQITIAMNSWGDWPSDITAKLYDITEDFDLNGLELVE